VSAGRLTIKEACQLTGLSKRELFRRASHDQDFPPFIKVLNKGVLLDHDEIRA
jgi:predicted DNA-binding transcriptional regulator AlpA